MATSDAPLLTWGRLMAPSCRRLVLDATAMPTPRPRVTKTGIAFMPRPYQVYAADLQKRLYQVASERSWEALQGPLVVRVVITKATPKKTVLAAPRGDVDNLAKGILDAATKTKRFWVDDSQITHLFVAKAWGGADTIEFHMNTLED
jgi:Holliday junction resolvase RusA-like endonuclease